MYTCAWELAATVTATTLCLGGNTITNLCHLFSILLSNRVCCWKSYLELWPRQRRYAASLPCGSNAVSAGLCSTLENYTSAILDDPVAKVTTWFAFLSACLFVSGWRAQFSSSYSDLLSIFRLRNQLQNQLFWRQRMVQVCISLPYEHYHSGAPVKAFSMHSDFTYSTEFCYKCRQKSLIRSCSRSKVEEEKSREKSCASSQDHWGGRGFWCWRRGGRPLVFFLAFWYSHPSQDFVAGHDCSNVMVWIGIHDLQLRRIQWIDISQCESPFIDLWNEKHI